MTSNGVGVRLMPGTETANPVALRMTSGGAPLSSSPRVAAATGSLRLATKTGSGFSPFFIKPSISASMAFRFPAWTRAR